mgnify:CR=1 FL=1
MKKLLLSAFVICLAGTSIAQESPLWMRHWALSPDGTTIAFTYKGDIYTVPSTGGRATQITTNPAFDTEPVWSPDSKQIAFASDRMGSLDVFVVSSEGGAPQRLTTHSGSEKPVAYKDNKHILFTANIAPSAEDAGFPSGQFQQVYEVAVTGGRPAMFSSMPMECISINKEGVMLYQDKKGYEDYVFLARWGNRISRIMVFHMIKELAEKAGTISWEIFTGIGPRVPRHYTH